MRILKTKFDIHTPWYKYPERDLSNYSQDPCDFLSEKHSFDCGDLCDIEITNDGLVAFLFKLDLEEKEVREICAIFLYFVSICNGYNCRFETTADIDGIEKLNFFTYAEEDKTELPLSKDLKYHEIALEDIKSNFGIILNKLLSENRYFMLALLSNYYSMVFYKDFAGNLEYKFRNIVTNLESLISIYYKDEYKKVIDKNKKIFDDLLKSGVCSRTKIKDNIMAKSISLENKLKDVLREMKKYGLSFRLESTDECKKIADTRNFISHLFDAEKVFLTYTEMSNYTAVLQEIFRILFLEHYGIEVSLIREKFLKNDVIRNKFKLFFDIEYNF